MFHQSPRTEIKHSVSATVSQPASSADDRPYSTYTILFRRWPIVYHLLTSNKWYFKSSTLLCFICWNIDQTYSTHTPDMMMCCCFADLMSSACIGILRMNVVEHLVCGYHDLSPSANILSSLVETAVGYIAYCCFLAPYALFVRLVSMLGWPRSAVAGFVTYYGTRYDQSSNLSGHSLPSN